MLATYLARALRHWPLGCTVISSDVEPHFSTENLTKVVDTRSIKVQSEAYIENALCETLKQSLRSVSTVSTHVLLEML